MLGVTADAMTVAARGRAGIEAPHTDGGPESIRDRNSMSRFARSSHSVLWRAAAAVLLTLAAAPASAQFSDSYKFLEAVRKSEGETVSKYVEAPGTTLINTRDRGTGETALLITIGRRDAAYTGYLLGRGARTDIAANDGRFPLMLAVERRFPEGIDLLLAARANVNQTNNQGETALMRAVQLKDVAMVRTLVAAGADPDKRDTLAGLSARDYAERDGRGIPGLIEALNAAKGKATAPGSRPVQGPTF